MFRLREIASVVVLAASAAWGQYAPQPPATDMSDIIAQTLDLSNYTIQGLDLPAEAGEGFAVLVNIESVDRILLLHPYSMRAAGYQVLVADEHGIHAGPVSASATYRGHVIGVADSVVSASLIDGQLDAMIDQQDGNLWFVQPLTDAMPGVDATQHVVYSAADSVADPNWFCGTDFLDTTPYVGDGTNNNFGPASPGNKLAEIAFDADFEFYGRNGSSVSATEADIMNVLNNVDTVYDRDTQINYTVTHIIVRTTSNDPYTSNDAGTRLEQFRAEWRTNQVGITRDVAHLMTGVDLNGGTIGVAWVGVICSRNLGYGLSQSRFSGNTNFRTALTAHELGHNWNSQHCDQDGVGCKIMCSGLNGCGGVGLPNFGNRSTNSIVNFSNSIGCLGVVPDDAGIDHQIVEVPISAAAKDDDATLVQAKTFDLQVVITEDDDWTSTGAFAGIDGSFYQHPTFDGDVVQSAVWDLFPSLEYDSFYSAPNFAVPSFAGSVDVTDSTMDALWFDTGDTGNGTFTIARYTLTAGTLLSVNGSSTAASSLGLLHFFDFDVDVVFPGVVHQVVEVPIDPAAVADDPTLGGAKTFDLQAVVVAGDDWTSTGGTASVDGAIYQHPDFDSNGPQSAVWPTFPSLEFDSFFSAPNFSVPGFAGTPVITNNSMSAVWFDTPDTGGGTFSIARFTVTSGSLLTISGTTTAANTQGDLIPFQFDVDVDLTPPCPGDLNGDGMRDQADLGVLLASYEIDDGGDINGDGVTDQADLGLLLSVYDIPCP